MPQIQILRLNFFVAGRQQNPQLCKSFMIYIFREYVRTKRIKYEIPHPTYSFFLKFVHLFQCCIRRGFAFFVYIGLINVSFWYLSLTSRNSYGVECTVDSGGVRGTCPQRNQVWRTLGCWLCCTWGSLETCSPLLLSNLYFQIYDGKCSGSLWTVNISNALINNLFSNS